MRNHYESKIGHFTNAIKPDVDTFRESLPIIESTTFRTQTGQNPFDVLHRWHSLRKSQRILQAQGFENVYQLEGGIIEYTAKSKPKDWKSKFIGKNFVFDHRLGERINR